MTKTFQHISSPSHGWLKVTMKDAQDVGLTEFNFSSYSYYRRTTIGTEMYLEEDCDIEVFLLAYKEKHGELPEIDSVYSEYPGIESMRRLP